MQRAEHDAFDDEQSHEGFLVSPAKTVGPTAAFNNVHRTPLLYVERQTGVSQTRMSSLSKYKE